MQADNAATEELFYRVERTEYTEIAVDVKQLLEAWDEPDADTERIHEILWEIGVRDLTYSGDFIRVLDSDDDENITLLPGVDRGTE